MLQYDPATSLQHHPTSMQRFGLNPYGQPLYRIVFSASRRNLVGGQWPDGSNHFEWAPTYNQISPAAWVLEKWLSSDDFAGVSKEYWEDNLLILGPWPERGEYQHAHTFEACGPTDANLDKLISWIEAGRNTSWQDNLDACRSHEAKRLADVRSQADARLRDAMSFKLDYAIAGAHAKRGTKTAKVHKSANELGLPTTGGKATARRVPHVQYEVPLDVW